MYPDLQTYNVELAEPVSESFRLFEYPIYGSSMQHMDFEKKCFVNCINQYAYMAAEMDTKFKAALLDSDILIPDGIGIVIALRLLKGIKIKKIAGSDIHEFLLKKLNSAGGRCFYLGSDENTLIKIKKRLAREYPSITMGYYSPPFKTSFDEADSALMLEKINSFKPDTLFVGMTAPKQENWTFSHKSQIEADVICCVGAVFDFYSGVSKRPSKFWINLGLEWFRRLLYDPRHTWRRYILYGPPFIFKIFRLKMISVFRWDL
jgi:N-acetylglucosaminyldiphosphoundecaprenol N-acetyl-beta-D-mannosaminyltransferase